MDCKLLESNTIEPRIKTFRIHFKEVKFVYMSVYMLKNQSDLSQIPNDKPHGSRNKEQLKH